MRIGGVVPINAVAVVSSLVFYFLNRHILEFFLHKKILGFYPFRFCAASEILPVLPGGGHVKAIVATTVWIAKINHLLFSNIAVKHVSILYYFGSSALIRIVLVAITACPKTSFIKFGRWVVAQKANKVTLDRERTKTIISWSAITQRRRVMGYEEWLLINKHVVFFTDLSWSTAVLVNGRFETWNLGVNGSSRVSYKLVLGTVKVLDIYTESFAQLFRFWFHIAIEVKECKVELEVVINLQQCVRVVRWLKAELKFRAGICVVVVHNFFHDVDLCCLSHVQVRDGARVKVSVGLQAVELLLV